MASYEECESFISHRLFQDVQAVLMQDLIYQFKIAPSKAKGLMYNYYRLSKNDKFNCVLISCHSNGVVRLIQDVGQLNDADETITDVFIYGFVPTGQIIPINSVHDQKDTLVIRNAYKLKESDIPRPQSASVKETPAVKSVQRAKTVPEVTKAAVKATETKPKKETGLRSTAILAKMRKEREEKEAQRQNELRKRREVQQQQERKRQAELEPQKKEQLEHLNSLFDDEDDDIKMETTDDTTIQEQINSEPSPIKEENTNLEDLLDTTAEDSLIEVKAKEENSVTVNYEEQKSTTYVDEDGYIVTKKATPPTTKQPATKSAKALLQKRTSASTSEAPKKKQRTIEGFFKKPSK